MIVATSEHITPDDESLLDLIANCSKLPPELAAGGPAVPIQRAAQPWAVDDTCLSRVLDLDDYGS